MRGQAEGDYLEGSVYVRGIEAFKLRTWVHRPRTPQEPVRVYGTVELEYISTFSVPVPPR